MRPTRARPAAHAAAVGLALVALAAPPARAQDAPRPRVTQTVTTNPLALPFGVASAEYERAVGARGLAVGVGAFTTLTRDSEVWNDGGSLTFRSAQLRLKYYPREDGLRGFAVGVTAGVAHERSLLTRSSYIDPSGREVITAEESASRTAPTLGAVLDYNFLLGRRRRFLVGLGVGARRPLGAGRGGPLGGPLVDGRLQVGVGF